MDSTNSSLPVSPVLPPINPISKSASAPSHINPQGGQNDGCQRNSEISSSMGINSRQRCNATTSKELRPCHSNLQSKTDLQSLASSSKIVNDSKETNEPDAPPTSNGSNISESTIASNVSGNRSLDTADQPNNSSCVMSDVSSTGGVGSNESNVQPSHSIPDESKLCDSPEGSVFSGYSRSEPIRYFTNANSSADSSYVMSDVSSAGGMASVDSEELRLDQEIMDHIDACGVDDDSSTDISVKKFTLALPNFGLHNLTSLSSKPASQESRHAQENATSQEHQIQNDKKPSPHLKDANSRQKSKPNNARNHSKSSYFQDDKNSDNNETEERYFIVESIYPSADMPFSEVVAKTNWEIIPPQTGFKYYHDAVQEARKVRDSNPWFEGACAPSHEEGDDKKAAAGAGTNKGHKETNDNYSFVLPKVEDLFNIFHRENDDEKAAAGAKTNEGQEETNRDYVFGPGDEPPWDSCDIQHSRPNETVISVMTADEYKAKLKETQAAKCFIQKERIHRFKRILEISQKRLQVTDTGVSAFYLYPSEQPFFDLKADMEIRESCDSIADASRKIRPDADSMRSLMYRGCKYGGLGRFLHLCQHTTQVKTNDSVSAPCIMGSVDADIIVEQAEDVDSEEVVVDGDEILFVNILRHLQACESLEELFLQMNASSPPSNSKTKTAQLTDGQQTQPSSLIYSNSTPKKGMNDQPFNSDKREESTPMQNTPTSTPPSISRSFSSPPKSTNCTKSTTISKVFIQKVSYVAPQIAHLRVLSFGPSLTLHPDALITIGRCCPLLERLDIAHALSIEYAPNLLSVEDSSIKEHGLSNEDQFPYEGPLTICVNSLTCLTRLDLGNSLVDVEESTSSTKNQTTQHSVISLLIPSNTLTLISDILHSRGGVLTLDKWTRLPQWASEEDKSDGKWRAMQEIMLNERFEEGIRTMAWNELNNLQKRQQKKGQRVALDSRSKCSHDSKTSNSDVCQKQHKKQHDGNSQEDTGPLLSHGTGKNTGYDFESGLHREMATFIDQAVVDDDSQGDTCPPLSSGNIMKDFLKEFPCPFFGNGFPHDLKGPGNTNDKPIQNELSGRSKVALDSRSKCSHDSKTSDSNVCQKHHKKQHDGNSQAHENTIKDFFSQFQSPDDDDDDDDDEYPHDLKGASNTNNKRIQNELSDRTKHKIPRLP